MDVVFVLTFLFQSIAEGTARTHKILKRVSSYHVC